MYNFNLIFVSESILIQFRVDYKMGRGGVGVCSVPCNRRVAGSNLPQATA